MAKISAILTAAGESTRMGTPKPMLDWKGVSLIEHQISTLIKVGIKEIVVDMGQERD